MKFIATRKSEQNESAIDPWTIVHLGVGLASGLMDIGFWPAMAAAAAYEVFEQGLERTDFGKDLFETSGPENLPNVLIDLVVFGVGNYVGRQWNET